MPEYLAPGVYVEETSYRSKTIEGVSTSIAGFAGPARFGPVGGEPELLTSFADFQRIYEGLDPLQFDGEDQTDNYIALAVRAFFDNGGNKLYVTRVFNPVNPGNGGDPGEHFGKATGGPGSIPAGLMARFPGVAGNMTITFSLKAGPNLLAEDPEVAAAVIVRGVKENDLVYIKEPANPPDTANNGLYDVVMVNGVPEFHNGPGGDLALTDLSAADHRVYLVTVNVRLERPGRFSEEETWEGFPAHPGQPGSLTAYFAAEQTSRRLDLTLPFSMATNGHTTGSALVNEYLGEDTVANLGSYLYTDDEWEALSPPAGRKPAQSDLETPYTLSGGSDGYRPTANDYRGSETGEVKTGLETFADLEDISIVAIPGCTSTSNGARAQQVTQHLISHCERMRYRIAVLDSPQDQMPSEVREFRGRFDSKYAALYYPWIRVTDPMDAEGLEEINLPPSGYVAGIYARNDIERGVHKAPANEVVRGAINFETLLNKAQQEILNPEGINCFRFFEGRGYRLWGARTISSDPEWKYVNLRRYFAFLERSIEKHTQWAVFENNSTPLWNNIRSTVEDFLYNEWISKHLMGSTPDEAYFVRCDRTTMTQNDIDNGRLICKIGVAPVRPAEFVIFRIGQWTADRKK
jgi:phage tail sheath protein FI